MKKNAWPLLAIAALAWFNAGTVWLIQFSCYPLWPGVGQDAFGTYFQFWHRSTFGVSDHLNPSFFEFPSEK